MKSELEKYGIQMPAFSKIGGILANELSVDEAACKSSMLWCLLELYLHRDKSLQTSGAGCKPTTFSFSVLFHAKYERKQRH